MEPLVVRVEDTEARTRADYAFSRSPIRIGRSVCNDVVAPQLFVSAWHGLVEFDEGGARYTDLGSTNGSVVDGRPLAPRSPVPLREGTEVSIGSLRVTFLRGQADESAIRETTPLARPGAGAEVEPQPVRPGTITALLRQLARAPVASLDQVWNRVLFPGAVIGRFELVREIGRGGFGVVFEARDRQLGRLVAFKAVRPGRQSQVRLRGDRLQKEAEAVAQLSHPNIVTLYDVGTCESGPFLILELLRGETLHARMKRAPIACSDALDVAIEIAWALDHAHRAGVVHRDLKPSNVMLCKEGIVKILDFGIAHVFGAGDARTVGTPSYMAPEQWRGEAQDSRADIFGAAAMLFESMSGRLPYRVAREGSSVLAPGARPDLDVPDLDPDLRRLLELALSPDRASRPRDGHAWLTALLQIRERRDAISSLRPLPVDRRGRRR